MPEGENKVVATNPRAYHDYFIEETVEAGIVLTGSEIKSVRAGRVSLREGYASIEGGELWLHNAHIAAYKQSGMFGHDPTRSRKLLLHRREINYFGKKAEQRGYTLLPLKMYIVGRRTKVELGLGKGKKLYDKREAIAAREAQREIDRALSHRQKGKRR